MIAAQLLAYYFTELKDDQIKKVSLASSAAPRSGLGVAFRHPLADAAAAASILYPLASGLPQASIGWTAERLGKASPLTRFFLGLFVGVYVCVWGVGKTPETVLLAAVSLKSAADVRWAPGYAGRWLCGDRWARS